MLNKASVFAVVALVQLAVPGWMIVHHERILSEGTAFNFRTAPVDPRDPFRGEYVHLDFTAEQGKWPLPSAAHEGAQRAYALLMADSAGFAQIDALVLEKPEAAPYIAVEYSHWTNDTLFSLELPFDRFYLEEGDGRRTEELLQPSWNGSTPSSPLPAYAVVRILHGEAVIEDLVIGGISIHQWLNGTREGGPVEVPDPATSVPSGS